MPDEFIAPILIGLALAATVLCWQCRCRER